ncbi:MAG: hypothetical protein ABIO29_00035 [Sphingomicrobium sp.]
MRRIILSLASSLVLSLAGCASAPQPTPEHVAPAVRPTGLIGLTGQEIANRLGVVPTLQIREGNGTKLQFRKAGCVLDAYLYPPARGGAPLVEHVDTRTTSGADRPEATCLADFQAARS